MGSSGEQTEIAPLSYDKDDQYIPETIPFRLFVPDCDTLWSKCIGEDGVEHRLDAACVSNYRVDWTTDITPPTGGGFVDETGELVDAIDGENILYLPPFDLACGESREIRITADAIDESSAGDPPWAVTFLLNIVREGDSLFDVNVVIENVEAPDDIPPPDISGFTPPDHCGLILEPDADTPIAEPILVRYPQHGILAGDIRPLAAFADDNDKVTIKCEGPTSSSEVVVFIRDGLDYKWSFTGGTEARFVDVSQNPPALVAEIEGREVLLKAPPNAETLGIKLEVDDKGEFPLSNEALQEIEFNIEVYRLAFAAQDGQTILTSPDEVSSAHLRISKMVTTLGMDSSGDDLDTYQVEVQGNVPGAPPAPIVELEVERHPAHPSEDYGDILVSFPMMQEGLSFRTDYVRLVSNKPPDPQPPGSLYDDEVLGAQTIRVLPEDRVKVRVLADGQNPAGTQRLLVARPPFDGGSSDAVLTGFLQFVRVVLPTDVPEVNPAYWIERATEDWAQACIQFDPVGGTAGVTDVAPVSNALWVRGSPQGGGTLHLVVVQSSVSYEVIVDILPQDTADVAVDKIANALNPLGLESFGLTHERTEGLLMAGKGVEAFFTIVSDTTGLEIDVPVLRFEQGILGSRESHTLHHNFSDDDDSTIDSLVVANSFLESSTSPTGLAAGLASIKASQPVSEGGLNAFLIIDVSFGTQGGQDNGFPTTFGHEIGHIILNAGHVDPPDSTNLMDGSAAETVETPTGGKRLTDPQQWNARSATGPGSIPQVLFPSCQN